jgi:hypothetical protein
MKCFEPAGRVETGRFVGRALRPCLMAILLGLMSGPAAAQMLDPFAGGSAVPGMPGGPYGSAAGANVHLLQTMSGADLMVTGATAAAVAETAGEGGEPAEAPEVEAGESLWEIFVGACAGGAFLGGYSAVSAATPVAATGVAAPSAAALVGSAAAIGCGLGVATAAVTLGTVSGWRSSVAW